MSKYTVAIVGVTGIVGSEVLKILGERGFPIKDLKLLASSRSEGTEIPFQGDNHIVHEAPPDSFDGTDLVFIAAGGATSKALAPEAARRGAIVIDKSSTFRMDPAVPLVVPEVNGDDIRDHQGIISSPNCSTIQLVVALDPLHRVNPIKRIIVDTYQSASGAGGQAHQDLFQQTRDSLADQEPTSDTFHYPLAFNAIPQIDVFGDEDYTGEEWKMQDETQRILHQPDLPVSATCVRIPVPISHSEAAHIEFTDPMNPQEAREILDKSTGISVIDNPDAKKYPLARDVAGTDDVFVGRIRRDLAFDNGLSMWIVADNIRKGAALNAVQIAEAALQTGA